jgi:hypothetical protein
MEISKGKSTTLVVNGKFVRLNEDIKGTISYVDGVTVSMLVSKKISKGQSSALVVYGKLARLDEDIKGTTTTLVV